MTMFVLGAAGLIALALWMLRPALRPAGAGTSAAHLGVLRDQLAALDREQAEGQLDPAQHRLARAELQRRVLDETAPDQVPTAITGPRWPLFATGLAVPLFAIALYSAIGNPAGMDAQQAAAPAAQVATEAEPSREAVLAMLATLAQRLEKPSSDAAADLQGLTMLARSYAALQRFADADRAFVRAIALAPGDAQLLADRADVLSMLQGQRSAGEPDRLIAEALRIDPRNLKALALAGSAAFERKDFAAARAYWQQARQLTPDGSAFAAGLDRSIAEAAANSPDRATAAATTSANTAPTTSPTPATAETSPARISGRVSLAPALAARAAPTDTVFVFARAAEGPRMPLAIVRRTVADLPFDFTLDDSQAMSPQMRLSGATRVIVGARISRSGNAMPQPGDLRGESAALGTRVGGLELVIDAAER